jgi:hypothetical protein
VYSSVEVLLSVPVTQCQGTVFGHMAFLANLNLAIWSLIDMMNTMLSLMVASAFILGGLPGLG